MALRTLILLLFVSPLTLASEFQPADFGKYKARFVESIKFPAGSEEVDLSIQCGAKVSDSGVVGQTNCAGARLRGAGLPDSDQQSVSLDQPFIEAITMKRRHLRIRIEPARAKRLKKSVWFQYTVRFERDAQGSRISVFPNHGHAAAQLGLNYTSPQRYENARGNLWRWCKQVFDGRVSGLIKQDGSAEDVTIEAEGSPTTRCVESIVTDFEKSKYIPAFADGSAVEIRLMQTYWGDTARKQLYVDASLPTLQQR